MDYEVHAKEVLRLVSLFEDIFTRSSIYCDAEIRVGDVYFKWTARGRQLQYRGEHSDRWFHAARVFQMEIPALLIKNIEELYRACLAEQSRVANVLSEASETGSSFADMLLLELNEEERNHAGNE
jgi:hypothetical protein|tara:strand:- start:6233 stop:6607 length:375 start_codon:yes stop_codon:yes gene_type:complete